MNTANKIVPNESLIKAPDHYPAMPRVIAHFQPQAWVSDNAMNIDGECDLDVTERLLSMPLQDIYQLADDDYLSDELVAGLTEHSGPHYVTVTESVLAFFGVDSLEDITEAMMTKKWLQYRYSTTQHGKLHNVHIFAVVRVEVRNVEAQSHVEAIIQAEAMENLHVRLNRGNDQEYTEEITCFLVDEHDETGVINSVWYGNDGVRPLWKQEETPPLKSYSAKLFQNDDASEVTEFCCEAEDIVHASEQAVNAYPGCTIVLLQLV